jgi:hypothetical protein
MFDFCFASYYCCIWTTSPEVSALCLQPLNVVMLFPWIYELSSESFQGAGRRETSASDVTPSSQLHAEALQNMMSYNHFTPYLRIALCVRCQWNQLHSKQFVIDNIVELGISVDMSPIRLDDRPRKPSMHYTPPEHVRPSLFSDLVWCSWRNRARLRDTKSRSIIWHIPLFVLSCSHFYEVRKWARFAF